MGATPVLCDCGDDGNIDPDAIEDLITPRSRAIIVTHMWGLPCDMERITAIARKHGLKVFEDISHAYGAMYKGAPVGTLSNAAALSLQGQKTLTGGEGGVLLTDDDEIFYRALAFGHYNKRCQKEIPEGHRLREFAVTGMGLKLRIHPIAAAIALEQLESIPNVMQGRQRCADIMTGLLSDVPEISLPRPSAHVQHGWYAYLIQLQGALVERSKDVLDAAHAEGLAELDQPRSTAPLHHYALFRNPSEIFPNRRPPASIAALPTADALYRRALKLPVWHREEDFELAMQYARGLRKVLRHFGDRA
jgi:dTDP-4-amino-4,6-dideoxygalactose transaminase